MRGAGDISHQGRSGEGAGLGADGCSHSQHSSYNLSSGWLDWPLAASTKDVLLKVPLKKYVSISHQHLMPSLPLTFKRLSSVSPTLFSSLVVLTLSFSSLRCSPPPLSTQLNRLGRHLYPAALTPWETCSGNVNNSKPVWRCDYTLPTRSIGASHLVRQGRPLTLQGWPQPNSRSRSKSSWGAGQGAYYTVFLRKLPVFKERFSIYNVGQAAMLSHCIYPSHL